MSAGTVPTISPRWGRTRAAAALATVAAGLAGTGPGRADVPFRLAQQEIVVLHVDVLRVAAEGTTALAGHTVEIDPEGEGALDAEVPWRGGPARLRLRASGAPGDETSGHEVSVRVEVSLGDERTESARTFRMHEPSTYLMDVLERDRERLVLALRAERGSRTVAIPTVRVVVGRAVRLRLELERVDGPRSFPLETNHLNTFVGQDVEYAFRRGEGDEAESVRLTLRPSKLRGDIAELEVEVSGSLPGADGRLLLSRRETLLSSRGAVSTLVVANGEPPAGYRFLITPDF